MDANASKKKKILHLSHTDIRTDSRILKAIEVGISAGFCVSAVGLETPGSGVARDGTDSLDITTKRLGSRKLGVLPTGLRHALSLIEAASRMIPTAFRKRPDLIHCHDTLVLPIAVVLKIVLRCKLIYDAHELESDRNGLSKFLGRATFLCEKLLWPVIDALIVVSPSIKDWYLSNIGGKRSEVILNSPVIGPAGRSPSRYLREKFGIPDEKPIFVYVGILGRGRGIERIIEAFERISSAAALVFLGFGELEGKIRNVSKREGSGVYLHSAVPHDEVVMVAASADVGLCMIEAVSLSDYLCLPNKLFEYAFAGLPVIASKFPDIAKVVEGYGLGVCADIDVDSISSAMGETCRERRRVQVDLIHNLSWQAQAARLNALYLEVFEK